jgi:hypothetical protein
MVVKQTTTTDGRTLDSTTTPIITISTKNAITKIQ